MREARAGLYPAVEAVERIDAWWETATAGEHREGELAAIIVWAISEALAEDQTRIDEIRTGSETRQTPAKATPTKPTPATGDPMSLVTTVADIEATEVEWLWPGRLPSGKIVVLDGDPSTGKSVLALDLAARVSTGARFPNEVNYSGMSRAGDVLVLAAEDAISDTIRPRLEAAGANLNRVHVMANVPTRKNDADGNPTQRLVSLPEDVGIIEAIVNEKGVKLVILDVLMSFLSRDLQANSDQDARAALTPLAQMAERTGCTVIALRHLNKSAGGAALYRGGSSIGIIGVARVGLIAGFHPDDADNDDLNSRRRVLAVTKSNLSAHAPTLQYRTVDRDGVVAIEWQGSTTITADRVVETSKAGERGDVVDTVDFLRAELETGPMYSEAIFAKAKREGFSQKQMHTAKKKLYVTARKERGIIDGGWFWSLPDDDRPPRQTAGDEPTSEDDLQGDQEPPAQRERSSSASSRHLHDPTKATTEAEENVKVPGKTYKITSQSCLEDSPMIPPPRGPGDAATDPAPLVLCPVCNVRALDAGGECLDIACLGSNYQSLHKTARPPA
jgi:hypothetical protein